MKTLLTVCALLLSAAVAGAAEQQVWVPGHWQVDHNGERQWTAGYYTTAIVPDAAPAAPVAEAAPAVPPPPQPVWVAGRWIWQSNAWVWQEGHWELPAPPAASAPAPVVVQQPPVVVESQPVYVEHSSPSFVFGATVGVPLYSSYGYCGPAYGHGYYGHGYDHGHYGHGGYVAAPLPLPPLIHGSINGHHFVGLPGLPPIPVPHHH